MSSDKPAAERDVPWTWKIASALAYQSGAWKLVPAEPTKAMLEAATSISVMAGTSGGFQTRYSQLSQCEAAEVWSSMLAASPHPNIGAVTQEQREERARQYGEQHRGERDAFDEMQRIRAGEWDASIARSSASNTAGAAKPDDAVERVARAICDANFRPDLPREVLDQRWREHREMMLPQARAAIRALTNSPEPTGDV